MITVLTVVNTNVDQTHGLVYIVASLSPYCAPQLHSGRAHYGGHVVTSASLAMLGGRLCECPGAVLQRDSECRGHAKTKHNDNIFLVGFNYSILKSARC